MPVDLTSKVVGGLMGSAIGDAIGELAFHYSKKGQLLKYLKDASVISYTDDTAMAIGMAESLIKEGALDQQRLGETFRNNFEREPWRGYASGPPTVFALVRDLGITYPEAARRLFEGRGSFGNGAAMRVAPVGLFYHGDSDLYEKAAASAEVTHAHPLGMDGAAVLALAVSQAVILEPGKGMANQDFAQQLIDFSRTPTLKTKMELCRELVLSEATPSRAADHLGRSVAVHESMPFAIFSFLRNVQSFEACLDCAVMNGGDRDTLGAMAGALSGAYLGIEAVPDSWKGKLENRGYIEGLALKLVESSPSCHPRSL